MRTAILNRTGSVALTVRLDWPDIGIFGNLPCTDLKIDIEVGQVGTSQETVVIAPHLALHISRNSSSSLRTSMGVPKSAQLPRCADDGSRYRRSTARSRPSATARPACSSGVVQTSSGRPALRSRLPQTREATRRHAVELRRHQRGDGAG